MLSLMRDLKMMPKPTDVKHVIGVEAYFMLWLVMLVVDAVVMDVSLLMVFMTVVWVIMSGLLLLVDIQWWLRK